MGLIATDFVYSSRYRLENEQLFKVKSHRVSVISASRALGIGGTRSFQAPRYPRDWLEKRTFRPPGIWRLAGLSSFRPLGTLGIRWTQSFQAPRILGPAGLSHISPPGTLGAGGTQSFQLPSTLGTGGTQPFQPPGTLGTGGTQSFQPSKYHGDWVRQNEQHWRVVDRVSRTGTCTLASALTIYADPKDLFYCIPWLHRL